jgi:hypothetical protein
MRWAISHTSVSLLLLCSQLPLAAQRAEFGANSTRNAPSFTTREASPGKSVGPAQTSWNQEDPRLPESPSQTLSAVLDNPFADRIAASEIDQIFRSLSPNGDPENPTRKAESKRSIPVSRRSTVDTRAHRLDTFARRAAVQPRRLHRTRQDWQVVAIPYTKRIQARPTAAVYRR